MLHGLGDAACKSHGNYEVSVKLRELLHREAAKALPPHEAVACGNAANLDIKAGKFVKHIIRAVAHAVDNDFSAALFYLLPRREPFAHKAEHCRTSFVLSE